MGNIALSKSLATTFGGRKLIQTFQYYWYPRSLSTRDSSSRRLLEDSVLVASCLLYCSWNYFHWLIFLYRRDYINFKGSDLHMDSYEDFLAKLAFSLIHNPILAGEHRESSKRKASQVSPTWSLDLDDTACKHTLKPLREHARLANIINQKEESKRDYRAQLHCRLCSQRCSHYCVECTSDKRAAANPKQIFACHDNGNGETCYLKHINDE